MLGGQHRDARTDDPYEQRRGDSGDDLTFEREEALRDHEGGEKHNVGQGTDTPSHAVHRGMAAERKTSAAYDPSAIAVGAPDIASRPNVRS